MITTWITTCSVEIRIEEADMRNLQQLLAELRVTVGVATGVEITFIPTAIPPKPHTHSAVFGGVQLGVTREEALILLEAGAHTNVPGLAPPGFITHYRNDENGALIGPHMIGIEPGGVRVYTARSGWTPVDCDRNAVEVEVAVRDGRSVWIVR